MAVGNAGVRGPIMLGIQGLALTENDRARLADPRVGGVILFARNFESWPEKLFGGNLLCPNTDLPQRGLLDPRFVRMTLRGLWLARAS